MNEYAQETKKLIKESIETYRNKAAPAFKEEQKVTDVSNGYSGKEFNQDQEVKSKNNFATNVLSEFGIDNPNKDAIDQLMDVFIPCLKIMCERGYDAQGKTWREKGWRGVVHDILNKAGRIRYRSWLKNEFDRDSAIDLINFCGFYIRMNNEGEPWGTWGEPDSAVEIEFD